MGINSLTIFNPNTVPNYRHHVFGCERFFNIHGMHDDDEITQGLVHWFESLPQFELSAANNPALLRFPRSFAKHYTLSKELLSRETRLLLYTGVNSDISHLLASSPHLGTIISISIGPWDEQSEEHLAEIAPLVETIGNNPSLSNAQDFRLSKALLTAPIAEALARSRYLTSIFCLSFAGVTFGDSDVAFQTLFHSPFVSNLEEIDCYSSPYLANNHLQIISTSPYLTNLNTLYLSDGSGRSPDLYDGQGLDYLHQPASIRGRFNHTAPGLVVWDRPTSDDCDMDPRG